MAVTLRATNLDKLAGQFDMGLGARPTIRMQIVVRGPAASYAFTWEWGRVDINPGPKTLWGTNPDGEQAVMTKTAPSGFVRVNRAKYRQIIKEELQAVPFHKLLLKAYPAAIKAALGRAANRCGAIIAATAPVDTGALREAIVSVDIPNGGKAIDSIGVRARILQ